eukprot:m.31490 g.31490  ORF g.31490 m.31490 type:complete len:383 (+) comp8324_c0_seq1:312-1460(+)
MSTFGKLDGSLKVLRLQEAISQLEVRGSCGGVILNSFDVALYDKLTHAALDIPCRGENCTHNECFNLDTYKLYNKDRYPHKCPLCPEELPSHKVYMDELFLRLCGAFENVSNVQINLDTQECKTSPSEKNHIDSVNVEEFVNEFDDDDDEIMCTGIERQPKVFDACHKLQKLPMIDIPIVSIDVSSLGSKKAKGKRKAESVLAQEIIEVQEVVGQAGVENFINSTSATTEATASSNNNSTNNNTNGNNTNATANQPRTTNQTLRMKQAPNQLLNHKLTNARYQYINGKLKLIQHHSTKPKAATKPTRVREYNPLESSSSSTTSRRNATSLHPHALALAATKNYQNFLTTSKTPSTKTTYKKGRLWEVPRMTARKMTRKRRKK